MVTVIVTKPSPQHQPKTDTYKNIFLRLRRCMWCRCRLGKGTWGPERAWLPTGLCGWLCRPGPHPIRYGSAWAYSCGWNRRVRHQQLLMQPPPPPPPTLVSFDPAWSGLVCSCLVGPGALLVGSSSSFLLGHNSSAVEKAVPCATWACVWVMRVFQSVLAKLLFPAWPQQLCSGKECSCAPWGCVWAMRGFQSVRLCVVLLTLVTPTTPAM